MAKVTDKFSKVDSCNFTALFSSQYKAWSSVKLNNTV